MLPGLACWLCQLRVGEPLVQRNVSWFKVKPVKFLFLSNLPGGGRVFCCSVCDPAVGFWRLLWCHLKQALLKITWINMPVMWLNSVSVTNIDKHVCAECVLSGVCDNSDDCDRTGKMGRAGQWTWTDFPDECRRSILPRRVPICSSYTEIAQSHPQLRPLSSRILRITWTKWKHGFNWRQFFRVWTV